MILNEPTPPDPTSIPSKKKCLKPYSIFDIVSGIYSAITILPFVKKVCIKSCLNLKVNEHIWKFKNLPKEFEEFKILHLSDLHIDAFDELTPCLINKLKNISADITVITGDFRFKHDDSLRPVLNYLTEIIPYLPNKFGIWGVIGNHDDFNFIPPFEKAGIKILLNQHVKIQKGNQSFYILGVDDPNEHKTHDLQRANLGLAQDDFKILLVHSPEIIKEAEAIGTTFYLAGHTHGGQICLPGIGPLISNSNCNKAYISGKWQFKDMQGYTNSGSGISCIPLRVFCTPEIAVHTLRRSEY
ncbi:MAG: metallophosphoesterase [Lentisphaeria bacterium]|nr:metallophosphoesterase [Lentisphaeria bacterium]